MFGYVVANMRELTKTQQDRYGGVYCGICRSIREQSSMLARLGLRYDMAFLALLHMSLYEPEDKTGPLHCAAHPLRRRDWIENEYVQYAADMNVALTYYKCLDDWRDDGSHSAKWMADHLEPYVKSAAERWPRQCKAIAACIGKLSALEQANCANPDEPANCFGELMGQLLVYREDLWKKDLYAMGMALGRFIYLADAARDYETDKKKGKYNPYLAMGQEADPARWEEYLLLTMGRCTAHFERLPLVQDKAILDNILYSGIWTGVRRPKKNERENV